MLKKILTWNGQRSFGHVGRHYTEPVAGRGLLKNAALPFRTEQRIKRQNPKRGRQLGKSLVELILVVVFKVEVVAEFVRYVGLGVVAARQDAILKI